MGLGASATLQGKAELLPAGQNDAGGQRAQTCSREACDAGRASGGYEGVVILQRRRRRCSC